MEAISNIDAANKRQTLLDQLTDDRYGLSILWSTIRDNVSRTMLAALSLERNNQQLATLIEQGRHIILIRADIEPVYQWLQSIRNALTQSPSTTIPVVVTAVPTVIRPVQIAPATRVPSVVAAPSFRADPPKTTVQGSGSCATSEEELLGVLDPSVWLNPMKRFRAQQKQLFKPPRIVALSLSPSQQATVNALAMRGEISCSSQSQITRLNQKRFF